jgi:hypothetical protein
LKDLTDSALPMEEKTGIPIRRSGSLDHTIEILGRAIERARVGDREKMEDKKASIFTEKPKPNVKYQNPNVK